MRTDFERGPLGAPPDGNQDRHRHYRFSSWAQVPHQGLLSSYLCGTARTDSKIVAQIHDALVLGGAHALLNMLPTFIIAALLRQECFIRFTNVTTLGGQTCDRRKGGVLLANCKACAARFPRTVVAV